MSSRFSAKTQLQSMNIGKMLYIILFVTRFGVVAVFPKVEISQNLSLVVLCTKNNVLFQEFPGYLNVPKPDHPTNY